jgi:hypothetical protein
MSDLAVRLRAAIRPYIVDEGPDLPPAPHEEHTLDLIVAAIEAVLGEAGPNDIEATGECCCNGCIGFGLCDLAEPEERAAAWEWAEATA